MDPEKLILSFVVVPLSTAGQPKQKASKQHTGTEETERQKNQRGGGKKESERTLKDKENRNTDGQRKDRHSKKKKTETWRQKAERQREAAQAKGKLAAHRDRGNKETEKTEREKKSERERETERQGEQKNRETYRQTKKRETGETERQSKKRDSEKEKDEGGGHKCLPPPSLFFSHSFCFVFWLVPKLLNFPPLPLDLDTSAPWRKREPLFVKFHRSSHDTSPDRHFTDTYIGEVVVLACSFFWILDFRSPKHVVFDFVFLLLCLCAFVCLLCSLWCSVFWFACH